MVRGFSLESSDRADFSEKVLSKRQVEIAQVKWGEMKGAKTSAERYWHMEGGTMQERRGRNSSVTGMERDHGSRDCEM